jgi:carbonic anhydrase
MLSALRTLIMVGSAFSSTYFVSKKWAKILRDANMNIVGYTLTSAIGLFIIMAFLIPPDYEDVCAPFLYGKNEAMWSGIPCKSGVVNQCGNAFGQSPIALNNSEEYALIDSEDNLVISDYHSHCLGEVLLAHGKLHFPRVCKPTVTFANVEYRFFQLHFHVGGSEHTIDSQRYDAELHLVHTGHEGLLVFGVLLDTSGNIKNEDFEGVISLFEIENAEKNQNDTWNPYNLLPSLDSYFSYYGSLTTPPCRPGVRWIVIEEPLQISKHQLAMVENHIPQRPNFRSLQAISGRHIDHVSKVSKSTSS